MVVSLGEVTRRKLYEKLYVYKVYHFASLIHCISLHEARIFQQDGVDVQQFASQSYAFVANIGIRAFICLFIAGMRHKATLQSTRHYAESSSRGGQQQPFKSSPPLLSKCRRRGNLFPSTDMTRLLDRRIAKSAEWTSGSFGSASLL